MPPVLKQVRRSYLTESAARYPIVIGGIPVSVISSQKPAVYKYYSIKKTGFVDIYVNIMAITLRLYIYIGLVLLLSINGFRHQRMFLQRQVQLHDAKLKGKDQKYYNAYGQNNNFDDNVDDDGFVF